MKTLLIANRGEIACRVIRSARALGISTVAVYSEADARSWHVEMADEAVCIGPAPVAESYLNGAAIIAAAQASGADAIHPGYGFLSENPDFVDAVNAAVLTFVGPSAEAIRAMGLKDQAKALMADAGVPVVPGYHGTDQDPDHLALQADAIGYPVMIKARAGGGGKGMRLVQTPEAFAESLASAQREAQASFGDPAVLIEKFIINPRHIEIQIFGDRHGNIVHLFERDCSIQRRYQKVLEEAPAPGMTSEVRAAMGAAAVAAARAVDYVGAGTVEFIVDGTGPLRPDGFWFMEMNTRLQVEHPVTEAVTGQDLVALQIAVARGEGLPFEQDDLSLTGHAIEARLYAEDVPAGFLPATGLLTHLHFGPDARIDTGVRTGDTITPFYDPMIAKVIAHGPDRDAAIARLRRALAQSHIAGCVTNRGFLGQLLSEPDVVAGRVNTGLIDQPEISARLTAPTKDEALPLAILAYLWRDGPQAAYRHFGAARQSVTLLGAHGPDTFTLLRDGTHATISTQSGSSLAVFQDVRLSDEGRLLHISSEEQRRRVGLTWAGPDHVTIHSPQGDFAFQRHDPRGKAKQSSVDQIRAPMPGRIIACAVQPGDQVSVDDPLVTLEAMKMEHTLRAPMDGTLAELTVDVGDQVAQGALLVRLEPRDA